MTEIFSKAALSQRLNNVERVFKSCLKAQEFVVIWSGAPIQKPGGFDQNYAFLPHPEYFWLTGDRSPHGALAYSLNTGWQHFVKMPSAEEKLWHTTHEVAGRSIDELEGYLKSHKPVKFFHLGQPEGLTAGFAPCASIEELNSVRELVNQVRRRKDHEEIALVKRAAMAAAAGYKEFASQLRAGVTEWQLKAHFESAVLRAGGDGFPYETLIGAGARSSVLHASPSHAQIHKGDLVLIDAGCEINDYCVDVTRAYFCEASPSSQQKAIYDLVLKAQSFAIDKCVVGAKWPQVHLSTAEVLSAGLVDLQILKGDPKELAQEVISVFLPHGLGHLVGLRVRDVGGVAGASPAEVSGVKIRVDLTLEENMLITVEPGLYFHSGQIAKAQLNKKWADRINWSELEKWHGFGGIRIEDDILIGKQSPTNLTALIPKL